MSLVFRITLIVVSLLSFIFVLWKIRKSQMRIDDSIFWLIFSVGILILSIFPQIATIMAEAMQMETTVNFIFLAFIFILLMKSFYMSIKISQLENKNAHIAQKLSLIEKELEDVKGDKKNGI